LKFKGSTVKFGGLEIELINTGSELMLGYVTNTHQRWLCHELSQLGCRVRRQVAISDEAAEIQKAVREALERADLVITTGGLGPTSDDLTREAVAELFGRTLREDKAILQQIEGFFTARRRAMPERVRVQALVPEGALVLPNGNGTAPGLVLEASPGQFGARTTPGFLIMLPGPPRELEPMFQQQVAPLLRKRFPSPADFRCLVLKSTGIGESIVEEKIAGPLQGLVDAGLELGYCARFGEVDVRLAARGPKAERIVTEAEKTVRALVGKSIFGTGDEQLEAVLVRELTRRGETVGLAESCTGGYIANRLTNVPGASVVLLGGFVTYSNAMKESALGVSAQILAEHGAVSEATARQMAEGARKKLGATYALAVTGIAGPTGGTPEKPVGTVYIALAGPEPTVVLHQVNRYDRESFKFVTSQQALDLLRRKMAG
jgi:nicotinamide-nucleotide amidase